MECLPGPKIRKNISKIRFFIYLTPDLPPNGGRYVNPGMFSNYGMSCNIFFYGARFLAPRGLEGRPWPPTECIGWMKTCHGIETLLSPKARYVVMGRADLFKEIPRRIHKII